ncbi:phytanoyl-CoA dioxygenase family protein [Nocardia gipuzkoensis]
MVVHFPRSASADEVIEAVRAEGVCIVDQLVDEDLMDRIESELRPYIDASPSGVDPGGDFQPRRTGSLIARSPTVHKLVADPLVLATVRGVLDKTTRFQLHLTEVITVEPGSPGQFIHRDQWAFEFPFPRGYEVMCNTIWALTPFTGANGATRLIPGSNHVEDGRRFEETEIEPAEMTRGSVVIYTGSLYHGGGSNRTETPRSGINITYSSAWLRQEENQYLSVPHEVARTLDNDFLRLIGYDRAGFGLGTWGDRADPLTFVKPDEGSTGIMSEAQDETSRAGNPELLLKPVPYADR